jgi:hypothetical protein
MDASGHLPGTISVIFSGQQFSLTSKHLENPARPNDS